MANNREIAEVSLRDQLTVLKRRKWIVFLVTFLSVGGTLAYSLSQKDEYTASANVLLGSVVSISTPAGLVGQQPLTSSDVDTAIQLFYSQAVKNQVYKSLKTVPAISVASIGDTDVLKVSAIAPQPSLAAKYANTYANAFVAVRQQQVAQEISSELQAVEQQINQVKSQIQQLNSQIQNAPARDQSSVANQLNSQISQLETEEGALESQLNDLAIAALSSTNAASVVDQANPPSSPSSPKPVQDGLLSLIIGLLLGCAIAYAVEYLDDTIKAKEEVEKIVDPVPVVGIIPFVENWKNRTAPGILALNSSKTPVAEAYRALRTSIQFISLDHSMKMIQVTSSKSREGKSTTVANLGMALAEAGQTVILMDADLRLPRLHEFFNVQNDIGFTSVLLGDMTLQEALQVIPTEQGRLLLLSSGPLPPNPSELLASKRAIEVFSELELRADVVLIDTPPVLPVTDAAIISKRVDATFVVVMAVSTYARELNRTMEVLGQVDASVLGAIFNGATPQGAYGSYYAYGYSDPYYNRAPRHSSSSRAAQSSPKVPNIRRA